MLDGDLAEIYQVLTRNLNLAVRRNRGRFPADLMFQLAKEEVDSLRLQFANLKRGTRRPALPALRLHRHTDEHPDCAGFRETPRNRGGRQ
ncbi:MAG: ORF6N domain-containing protein [Bryobacteraceae bacterium]